MKRAVWILTSLVLTIGLLAACGGGSGSKTSSSKETYGDIEYTTVEKGVLSVGIEIGYPPMEYYEEDGETLIGFDVEMIKAVADELGLELKLVDKVWDGIFDGLNKGEYDVVVSSVSWTEDRNDTLLLSKTYISNGLVLVVPKDSTIKDIEDLEGKYVAVQMESTADYLMQRKEADGMDVSIRLFDKVLGAYDELKAGRVDAVCSDSVVAAYYLGDEASNYRTAWESDEREPICMAFKKGNEETRKAVETALDVIKERGILGEIAVKYFGTEDILTVN